MGTFKAIVTAIAAFFGFAEKVTAEIHDAEQRQQGRVAQHDADETVSNAAARAARVVEANDAALPDADLDQRLRRPSSSKL